MAVARLPYHGSRRQLNVAFLGRKRMQVGDGIERKARGYIKNELRRQIEEYLQFMAQKHSVNM